MLGRKSNVLSFLANRRLSTPPGSERSSAVASTLERLAANPSNGCSAIRHTIFAPSASPKPSQGSRLDPDEYASGARLRHRHVFETKFAAEPVDLPSFHVFLHNVTLT